ncbi:Leucyl aminopeptidase yscIV [Tulasnella sp. 418]|nr:Leucyl aminopeptidase yscIV [Tulasnella sp. 418]
MAPIYISGTETNTPTDRPPLHRIAQFPTSGLRYTAPTCFYISRFVYGKNTIQLLTVNHLYTSTTDQSLSMLHHVLIVTIGTLSTTLYHVLLRFSTYGEELDTHSYQHHSPSMVEYRENCFLDLRLGTSLQLEPPRWWTIMSYPLCTMMSLENVGINPSILFVLNASHLPFPFPPFSRMHLSSTLLIASSLLSTSVSASKIDDLINFFKLPLTSTLYQNDFKTSALKTHAEAFQKIADQNGGTRVFGSPGYNASVEYVYKRVKKAGYDVQLQTFPHNYEEVITQTLVVADIPINITGMTYSPSGPTGGISAPLILVPDLEAAPSAGCTDGDFAGLDLKGKIAFVQRGSCSFAIKAANAKAHGAVGAVTGNQSNVIFIGGHLDSVKAGPGLNDDGSGSITVLELALQLAKYKLNNAVRFGWWTAEEFGLVGSTHYVNSLSQEEKDKIALYINLDMVASPNPIFGVLDSDNSAGQNNAEAPAGSAAVEAVLIEYFTKNKLPSVPSNFNGRSDYASFIANGIPAGGLFTGAEGIKTEEQAALFGGTAGLAYDPNYHQKGDTITNLDYNAWIHNAKSSAHAIATFIKSTARVEELQKAVGARLAPVTTSNEGASLVDGDACGGEAI